MNAADVFAGVFIILVVITLFVPSFPPGELILDAVGFSQAPGSFLGITVPTLLNSLINGLLWGTIGAVASAVYALSQRGTRRKPLLPLRKPEPLPSPPLRVMHVDDRVETATPAITVKEGYVPPVREARVGHARDVRIRPERDIDVKTIEGIGSWRGRTLNSMGVRTVEDLLSVGGTSVGRHRIARRLGVSQKFVVSWVRRADLLRVRGVGRQYSELLESAGVSSVTDLSNRNALVLWHRLRSVNREKRLVRRVPPCETVKLWVHNAKKLHPVIA